MRIWCALFLAGTVLAQDHDPQTYAGMEAEARGDWVAACRAFKAALEAGRDRHKSARLRHARDRAIDFLGPEIDTLLKANQYREAVPLVAAGLAIRPKYHKFSGAAKRLARKGIEVPELAPLPDRPFAMRSTTGRAHAAAMLGAPFGRGEAMVSQCLDFLAEAQNDEGFWDCDQHGGLANFDAGVTGLALMAILSQGNEGLAGPLGGIARKGVAWLEKTQRDNGVLGTLRTHNWIYCHSLAAEAIAEYAILTGDLKPHRACLEKARDFLLEAQNPGKGWRYEPRGGESDTCATLRAITALQRMRLAGIDVKPTAFAGAFAWVEQMTDKKFGQIGYNYPGGVCARPEGKQNTYPPERSQAMTAAGTIVYVYCGYDPWKLGRSFARIDEIPPLAKYPDKYYWDAGARAFQAALGHIPYAWYEALVECVGTIVEPTGRIRSAGVWSHEGGRIYDAAMCVLALTAPYRESPRRAHGPRDFLRRKRRQIVFPGDLAELPTGIYLDADQSLLARATGGVVTERNGPSLSTDGQAKGGGGRVVGSYPFACLLGRIGPDGKPFRIHAGEPFPAKSYGQLYLLINDEKPRGNYGWWDITLELAK